MAIFGNDGRIVVEAVDRYPFSAVTSIITTWKDGTQGFGSGAMVGANDVLTAAHVVYNESKGGFPASVTVIPGRFDAYYPFGAHDAATVHVHPEYAAGDRNEDLAMLTLSTDLGNETGWFGFNAPTTVSGYQGHLVESAGYPGDWYGWSGGASVPGYTSGVIDYADVDTLYFASFAGPYYDEDLDSWPGQSGSPIVYTHPGDGGFYVVGVVSYQRTDGQGNGYNAAASLFDDLALVNQWVDWQPTQSPPPTRPPEELPPGLVLGVALVYEAALNRRFDAPGLNHWIDQAEAGASSLDIAAQFLASHEFQAAYGNPAYMTDREYISRLYLNILDRQGEAGGINYWAGEMAAGATHAQVLVGFAGSPENVQAAGYLANLQEVSPGYWDLA